MESLYVFPGVHVSQKAAILESRRLFLTKGLKECLLTARDGRRKVGKKMYVYSFFWMGKACGGRRPVRAGGRCLILENLAGYQRGSGQFP